MSYRDEYREFQRESYWTIPRALTLGLVASVLFGVVVWIAGVLLIPTQVLNPTNAIANYEWFHDTYRSQQARVKQIASHRALAKDNADPAEASRLRIEITGMQAACRDLVARYNSRATQIHRGLFQGSTVPANLDAGTCE